MNELIHDVEESLRQEKLHAMWKEYGPYLIAGCVLAVLFTALSSLWRNHEYRVNTTQTAAILSALDSPDTPASLDKIAASLRPAPRALALLSEAGTLLQKDKQAEALAVYERAAADRSLPEPFHGLAVLLDVRLAASMKDSNADPKTLLAKLQPLIADGKSPWQNYARIQAALIDAHQLNDYTQARAMLAPIRAGTDDISQALHQRAQVLDLVYAAEGGQEPK